MRIGRRLFLALILLIVAGIGILFLLSDGLARQAVERGLAQTFATPATFDRIEVRLLSGRCHVSGLSIQNPEAFGPEPFLQVASVDLQLGLSTLLGTETRLDVLEIEKPVVRVILAATGHHNLDYILLPGQGDSATGAAAPDPSPSDGSLSTTFSSFWKRGTAPKSRCRSA